MPKLITCLNARPIYVAIAQYRTMSEWVKLEKKCNRRFTMEGKISAPPIMLISLSPKMRSETTKITVSNQMPWSWYQPNRSWVTKENSHHTMNSIVHNAWSGKLLVLVRWPQLQFQAPPPTNNQVMLKLLQLVYNPPPLETVTACAIPCGTVTW